MNTKDFDLTNDKYIKKVEKMYQNGLLSKEEYIETIEDAKKQIIENQK
jgi:uncharacterized protein YqgQ